MPGLAQCPWVKFSQVQPRAHRGSPIYGKVRFVTHSYPRTIWTESFATKRGCTGRSIGQCRDFTCTRWPSAWRSQCILTLLKSRQACSSFGCYHLFARPYVCSRRLVRIEALHDTAIGVAFDTVLGRTCSCGCLIGNRNAEYSTQVCNGHRSTGDPDLGSLFCFQPGPFPTCFQRISQYHAGSALVWPNVWRLHRGFFPCPRIYLWGRK